MRRLPLIIVAIAAIVLAIWLVWIFFLSGGASAERDEYATKVRQVAIRMDEVGTTLNRLSETNPFQWYPEERAQWEALRSTITLTQTELSNLTAPSDLLQQHGRLVQGLNAYAAAFADLDAFMLAGPGNAKPETLDAIIATVDTADTDIRTTTAEIQRILESDSE